MGNVKVMIPAHSSVMRRDHGLHAALVFELGRRSVKPATAVCKTSGARRREKLGQQTPELGRRERIQNRIDGRIDWHNEDDHPYRHFIYLPYRNEPLET